MQKPDKHDGIPYQSRLDLIERHLVQCLENIKQMRQDAADPKAVKKRCVLVRAALGNARHYLSELAKSL